MGQIIDPTRTQLELELLRNPKGDVFYVMSLRSKAKPQCISKQYVKYDAPRIERQMAVVAGALAEHQNELYDDWHDPDIVAKTGVKAFERLKKKIYDEGITI